MMATFFLAGFLAGQLAVRRWRSLAITEPFRVVRSFANSDPEIENPQPAADAADKSVTQESTQVGMSPEKRIVGPLQTPRQKGQPDSKHGTEQNKQRHRNTI